MTEETTRVSHRDSDIEIFRRGQESYKAKELHHVIKDDR
jgi:hypothetical protein